MARETSLQRAEREMVMFWRDCEQSYGAAMLRAQQAAWTKSFRKTTIPSVQRKDADDGR